MVRRLWEGGEAPVGGREEGLACAEGPKAPGSAQTPRGSRERWRQSAVHWLSFQKNHCLPCEKWTPGLWAAGRARSAGFWTCFAAGAAGVSDGCSGTGGSEGRGQPASAELIVGVGRHYVGFGVCEV